MLSMQTKPVDLVRRIGVMSCALWLLAAPALAEGPTNQLDRCQAPDRQQNQNADAANESDTRKLADFNGVLKPPSMGDSDFVVPAPQIGDTPVIPPGEIPQKQQ
jgi:hypothetical protein